MRRFAPDGAGGGRDDAASPSGRQLEIAAGDQRAVVVEVGGGLRAYAAAGRDVLDGYGIDEPCSDGRGQVLLPWPNRLQDGRYEFAGRSYEVEIDEPALHNAIHGLVRGARWRVGSHEGDRVAMELDLEPQPGYPFPLALRVEYRLAGDGLHVRTTATNTGGERCPFGDGMHPYVTVGTPVVDEALLRVPASRVLRTDDRAIPVGAEPVADTEYDFRSPRPIGPTRLDHCFTDLERDGDGRARVQLRAPGDGPALTLWVDGSYPYLMVFTGDPLPTVNRRSVAIEPMSCPANAFRSGESLVVLEPGASWVGEWGIDPAGGG